MIKMLLRLPVCLLILLLTGARPAGAQAPAWAWAESPGTGWGSCTATDAAGNVYVAGIFSQTLRFGDQQVTTADWCDIFVAKRNPAGQYEWVVKAGGPDYDNVRGLTVDGAGNVIVEGVVGAPVATFGAITLPGPLAYARFVAKLSPVGDWQWVRTFDNRSENAVHAVAVDAEGNTLLSGVIKYYQDTLVYFGGYPAPVPKYGWCRFLALFDPAGICQWVQHTRVGGGAVTAALDGGFYVAGGFSDTLVLGGDTLRANPLESRLYVGRIELNGQWRWTQTAVTSAINHYTENYIGASALAVQPTDGTVVVTGMLSAGDARFGSDLFLPAVGQGVFVATLTPAGTWQWAAMSQPQGYNTSSFGSAIAATASGIHVVADIWSDSLQLGAIKLDGLTPNQPQRWLTQLDWNGNWTAATRLALRRDNTATAIAATPAGEVILTGAFEDSLTLGPYTLRGIYPFAPTVVVAAYRPVVLDGAQVYPNPANAEAQLRNVPPSTLYTLFDPLGRPVCAGRTDATGGAILDVRGLAPGLYTVRAGAVAHRLVD